MPKLADILNHSDDLTDESSTVSSSTPSTMSLSSTSASTPLSSVSTSSFEMRDSNKLPMAIKEEPTEGSSEYVKRKNERNMEHTDQSESYFPPVTQAHSSKVSTHPYTFPKTLVNKKLLNKKLVQIAIRRKSLSGKESSNHGSKLHTKSLEASLRVKLTLAPDLISLYNSLTPHTNRRKSLRVFSTNEADSAVGADGSSIMNSNYLNDVLLSTKAVQLIDNNLVKMSVFSNKVMKTFQHSKTKSSSEHTLPTFNSLATAIHTLFGIDEYSLVRVTRSTATDYDGSILLKFETAKPGELNLIDDEDFTEDMLHSLGQVGSEPSNIFIKKVIARPRYKSDMKIYLIPKNVHRCLYVDQRMFERDLINGVIRFDVPFYKTIYCAFDYEEVLQSVKDLVKSIPCLSTSPAKSFSSLNQSPIPVPSVNDTSTFGVSPTVSVPTSVVGAPYPLLPPIKEDYSLKKSQQQSSFPPPPLHLNINRLPSFDTISQDPQLPKIQTGQQNGAYGSSFPSTRDILKPNPN